MEHKGEKLSVFKRKIQKFSNYSYAITLPTYWLKKNNLDCPPDMNIEEWKNAKNPVVTIFEMPGNSLQIFPSDEVDDNEEIPLPRINLNQFLEERKDFIKEKTIKMVLISFYINGAPGIEIFSKNPIQDEIIQQVEQTQERLLFNWNLTKESDRKIIIKNVFKERPEEIFSAEIPRFLRESFSIILSMIENITKAIKEKNPSFLQPISSQDEKIDKFYFFIVRQIRNIFDRRVRLKKPIKYSHKKLVDLRLLAKLIEDVGDLLKESGDILMEYFNFIHELQMEDYFLEYLGKLYKIYSLLADELRRNLSSSGSSMGMNEKIMSLIQEFRKEGRELDEKWNNLIKSINVNEIKILDYSFANFFNISRLVNNFYEMFQHIFDFTNLFF